MANWILLINQITQPNTGCAVCFASPSVTRLVGCFFFSGSVLVEFQRQGEWRAGWHRYIFALPNDTNTISWLCGQIESHSLFVSLTLCPVCVSLSCTTLHHSLLMQAILCAFYTLPYIDVLHSPCWMLFNCIWVCSLPVLKPKDMEFVSLPIQEPQGAVCELTALLESGP